jgi:hypothetical protein
MHNRETIKEIKEVRLFLYVFWKNCHLLFGLVVADLVGVAIRVQAQGSPQRSRTRGRVTSLLWLSFFERAISFSLPLPLPLLLILLSLFLLPETLALAANPGLFYYYLYFIGQPWPLP